MRSVVLWALKTPRRCGMSVVLALLRSPSFRLLLRRCLPRVRPRKEVALTVRGHRMYASAPDRIAALLFWKFCLLEDLETKIVRQVVKEGMVALDLGANLGYHTLELARLVGPHGKVFAFEPAPENYALLVKNIASNHYRNVTAFPKAASDQTGAVRLFLSEEHAGDHRIFDSGDGRNFIEVETVALDDFLPAEQRVDFIKMDIQGAEYLALCGMERLVRRSPHLTMICAFAPSLLPQGGASAERLIGKLQECGFRLRFINEGTERVEPIEPEALMRLCRSRGEVMLYLDKQQPPGGPGGAPLGMA